MGNINSEGHGVNNLSQVYRLYELGKYVALNLHLLSNETRISTSHQLSLSPSLSSLSPPPPAGDELAVSCFRDRTDRN